MAAKKEKRSLGRGLSALMADAIDEPPSNDASAPTGSVDTIAIDRISANPDQPRRVFDKDALEDLANSVREKGILQPIVLRPSPRDSQRYEIVAGERRWRAAQMAQLHEVPAIVREFTDVEVLEVAIIENVQRQDLNPVEEALGYQALIETFGHTQEQLAQALSKSRSYIANATRLLTLPKPVLDYVSNGDLSAGHARTLITATDPIALAGEVIKRGLSVRETEKLVKNEGKPAPVAKLAAPSKDADTRALETDLAASLGLKVSIDHREGSEKGSITLSYKSLEQLDEICRRLSLVDQA